MGNGTRFHSSGVRSSGDDAGAAWLVALVEQYSAACMVGGSVVCW